MASVANMKALSFELLVYVAEFTNAIGQKKLRLVCKHLESAATAVLFRNLKLYPDSDSFMRLTNIAANAILARLVRCVIYSTETIPDWPYPPADIQTFRQTCVGWGFAVTDAAKRVFRDQHLTKQNVYGYERAYQAQLNKQWDIIRDERHREDNDEPLPDTVEIQQLKSRLGSFLNLDSFEFYSSFPEDNEFQDRRDHYIFLEDHNQLARTLLINRGSEGSRYRWTRRFIAFAVALHSENIKIKHLTFTRMDLMAFREVFHPAFNTDSGRANTASIQTRPWLPNLIDSLKTITIDLWVSKYNRRDIHESVVTEQDVGRLITSASGLEKLDLDIPPFFNTDKIVPFGPLPKLITLRLRRGQMTVGKIIEIFQQHPQLEHVSIDGLHLCHQLKLDIAFLNGCDVERYVPHTYFSTRVVLKNLLAMYANGIIGVNGEAISAQYCAPLYFQAFDVLRINKAIKTLTLDGELSEDFYVIGTSPSNKCALMDFVQDRGSWAMVSISPVDYLDDDSESDSEFSST